MSAVTVHLKDYGTGGSDDHRHGIEVDYWEGQVHLTPRGNVDSDPSMHPVEARALAAALLHAATEAER